MLLQAESTEAYLHGLLRAVPDAAVMTTADGRIARVNRQTERLFGYRGDELIGQHIEVLMPERFRQTHMPRRTRYAAVPRFWPMGGGLPLWGQRSDGSEFPVEVRLSFFLAPDGFYILSAIRDVSERGGVEQALRESERFARATFDALRDHICVLDETATIVSTNAAWDAFAVANGADPERTGKGVNYLDVCATATGPAAAAAGAFADGIRAVMRGEQDSCACEYSCHAPHERRWFIARATRCPGAGPIHVVIAHEDVTELKLAELELHAANDAAEAAVAAERGRLGRELHDTVTQAIFSASLIADSLPRVWERSPDEGRRGLDELRQLTRGALAEMRTLLFELRPAALQEKRLSDLIGQLAVALSSRTGMPVDVVAQEEGTLPPEVHVALYRIAQEALNNVAKHAGATRVSVRLRATENWAAVRIRDDGRGFDVSALPGGHLGLGIMQERATSVGARLRIVGRPGRGTIVAATWEDDARRRQIVRCLSFITPVSSSSTITRSSAKGSSSR